MGFKPSSLKKEELENKIRAEDAAKEAAHEAEVAERRAEVKRNTPVNMAPDGDPKDAKGHTEGSMTQWMFTVSNQLAEMGNNIRELKTLLSTLALQANSGKVVLKEKLTKEQLEPGPMVVVKQTKAEAEKTAAEVLANNKHKNGKPPAVVDVPTLEVLAAQMGKYIKRYGKGALETRLAQYDVKKASDIPEEKRHLFLQDIAT